MTDDAELSGVLQTVDQVGVVVDDLEPVRVGMERLFGLQPRRAAQLRGRGEYRSREADANVDVLFYDLGGIEFEFLCPRGGQSVWQEFLDHHGSGLHHVRFRVADQAAARRYFADRGVEPVQVGDSSQGEGITFAYHDTGSIIGLVVETFG